MSKKLNQLQIATASSDNQQASLGIIIGESVGMGAIFIMMLNATWRKFLEAHLKKILFPLAVICDITLVGLVWHLVYLNPKDKNLLLRAAIESVGVLIEIAAILMVVISAAVAGVITPLLLTAATGAKALVNTGLGIFYAVNASQLKDTEQKNAKTMLALECGVQAFCGALITIATAGAMLAGQIAFAVFGVVAAIVAITICSYKWATVRQAALTPPPTIKKNETQPQTIETEMTTLSETAKIVKTLQIQTPPTIKPVQDLQFPDTPTQTLGSNNLKFFPNFDDVSFDDEIKQPEVIYTKRLRGG